MNAQAIKSAILMCANRNHPPGVPSSTRCELFVCSLAGALSVVGDLEMVNALKALADLPPQKTLGGD